MAETSDTSAARAALAARSSEMSETNDDGQLTVAGLINRQRAEIERALPKHMDADRLARIATTVIKSSPILMQCTSESLLGALMLSAQTGLEPGPLGHAYFTPRRNKGKWECQWIIGYKGIIELARRSGKILSIEARDVCEHDEFDFEYGLNEKLVHRPVLDGPRGDIVAFWGLARFADGGHYFVVLSRADVDEHRGRSDSFKANGGPWITDYAAMGRKTVIRVMQPFLPLTAEQAAVLSHDETVANGIRPDMAFEPVETSWIDVPSDPAETTPTEMVDGCTCTALGDPDPSKHDDDCDLVTPAEAE